MIKTALPLQLRRNFVKGGVYIGSALSAQCKVPVTDESGDLLEGVSLIGYEGLADLVGVEYVDLSKHC